MADVGQRGVEVDEVFTNMVYAARQALSAGEGTLDNRFMQIVFVLELVAVLLVAWLGAGKFATSGVLAVVRHHAVEGEAR